MQVVKSISFMMLFLSTLSFGQMVLNVPKLEDEVWIKSKAVEAPPIIDKYNDISEIEISNIEPAILTGLDGAEQSISEPIYVDSLGNLITIDGEELMIVEKTTMPPKQPSFAENLAIDKLTHPKTSLPLSANNIYYSIIIEEAQSLDSINVKAEEVKNSICNALENKNNKSIEIFYPESKTAENGSFYLKEILTATDNGCLKPEDVSISPNSLNRWKNDFEVIEIIISIFD